MEMIIRRCSQCGNTYLDDVDICPACPGISKTVQEMILGNGTIYTFSRVHVAPEQFKSIVPYYIAIVQMDGGPRCLGRLLTQEGDHVRIDAPVELISTEAGPVFALK
jgi:uncharacterized OB-fold protein